MHAERIQMQPGDRLVEVLGQRIHPERILLGLGEELDLGKHLVGERVAHDEAGVSGRIAEIHQPAFAEHDDAVPFGAVLGELPLVYLRLDVDLGRVEAARQSAMSISLSKCPMLHTIAWCFIRRIWSAVITSRQPVAVT